MFIWKDCSYTSAGDGVLQPQLPFHRLNPDAVPPLLDKLGLRLDCSALTFQRFPIPDPHLTLFTRRSRHFQPRTEFEHGRHYPRSRLDVLLHPLHATHQYVNYLTLLVGLTASRRSWHSCTGGVDQVEASSPSAHMSTLDSSAIPGSGIQPVVWCQGLSASPLHFVIIACCHTHPSFNSCFSSCHLTPRSYSTRLCNACILLPSCLSFHSVPEETVLTHIFNPSARTVTS